jgi:hypothetical protein
VFDVTGIAIHDKAIQIKEIIDFDLQVSSGPTGIQLRPWNPDFSATPGASQTAE